MGKGTQYKDKRIRREREREARRKLTGGRGSCTSLEAKRLRATIYLRRDMFVAEKKRIIYPNKKEGKEMKERW